MSNKPKITNLTDFQKHFVRTIVYGDATDPLVFIEILANLAQENPKLKASIIAAMKEKRQWYLDQVDGLTGMRDLEVMRSEKGNVGIH